MTANATDHLRAGDLAGALSALQDQVRARPEDARLRIFLFQLLCVLGDWQRAVAQLKVCAQLDAEAVTMAQTYREAIVCEVFREKVFAGEKEPLIFGQPQEWTVLLVHALGALARGQAQEAADLRARAFEAAPATPGTLNDTDFDWIADADMRLGPVLEIIINGRYTWLPFDHVASIRAEPPADLRDAVWMPVELTLQNGGEFVALIPTRYPATVAAGSDAEKLARATSWRDAGAETFTGLGQRLLATDAGDTALMDLRHLQLRPVVDAGPQPDGAAADG